MPPNASSSTDPSARAHLDGADANVAFGEMLANAHGTDAVAVGWAVVAMFYAAIHETRAYLVARHGMRVVAHEDMRRVWTDHPEMSPAKAPYTDLKQQSESVRYYLNRQFTSHDVAHFKGRYELVRSVLRPKTERALQDH